MNNQEKNSVPAAVIGEEGLSASSYWKDIRRSFCKNKIAVIGLILLIVIVILCVGAPLFTKYDPVIDMNPKDKLLPPGSEGHLLGTNHLGQDIWSMLVYGARTSLLVAVVASFISGLLGIIIGGGCYFFSGVENNLTIALVAAGICLALAAGSLILNIIKIQNKKKQTATVVQKNVPVIEWEAVDHILGEG